MPVNRACVEHMLRISYALCADHGPTMIYVRKKTAPPDPQTHWYFSNTFNFYIQKVTAQDDTYFSWFKHYKGCLSLPVLPKVPRTCVPVDYSERHLRHQAEICYLSKLFLNKCSRKTISTISSIYNILC